MPNKNEHVNNNNNIANINNNNMINPNNNNENTNVSGINNNNINNENNKINNINNTSIDINVVELDMSWQTVPAIKLSKSVGVKRKIAPHNADAGKRNRQNSFETSEYENQFLMLCDDDDDVEECEAVNATTEQRETHARKVPKPPPIFVPGVSDIKKLLTSVNIITKSSINYKCTKDNHVKLMPPTSEAYRAIVSLFKDKNMSYHTYQLKQQREFKIVIRGLHHTTSTEYIKNELKDKGHIVRNLINVRNKYSKAPMPMFFVGLEPNNNNKEVYSISSIGNAIVTIEPPHKKKDIVQCHRCQQYGHTKQYCNKKYRCVKCGLDHPSAECNKAKSEPPKCVHCSAQHTGNYRGCPVYQGLIKQTTNSRRPEPLLHQTVTPNISYAQRLRQNTDNNTSNNCNNFSNNINNSYCNTDFNKENVLISKINEMISEQKEVINLFKTMMNTLNLLLTKLCI